MTVTIDVRFTKTHDRVARAMMLAAELHGGQVDKQGQPYVLHLIGMASRAAAGPVIGRNNRVIVALLHDVLEDTNFDWLLIRERFGEDVCEAVLVLTHRKNESYEEYIRRVKEDTLARDVKLADIQHNLSRIHGLHERDPLTAQRLWKKYQNARGILLGLL